LETGLFEKGKLVIDVGTGGGFPLMPLALSCPECRFLGIDSVRKKTLAVNEMLADL
jgi:ribosomal RNA small subunit methyltransferase G